MVSLAAPASEDNETSRDDFGAAAPEQLVVGEPSVDSQAWTESAVVETPASHHADPNEVGNDASPNDRFRPPGSTGESQHIAPPIAASSSPASLHSRLAEPNESIASRQHVDELLLSEGTRRAKQLALVAMLAIFGLISAAIVFSQVIRSWTSKPSQDALAASETVKDAAISQSEPLSSTTQNTTEPPRTPGESEQVDAPESGNDADLDDGASTVNDLTDPGAQAPAAPQATIATTDSPAPSSPAPLTTAPSEPNTAVVSNAMDKAIENRGEGQDPPALNNLPPGLMKFTPLLSLETADNQPAQIVDAPPTIDTVRIDAAAERAELAAPDAPARKPLDIEKQLSQRFAIDNQGASLAELVLVLSQLTAVPIEFELIAFDAAGLSVQTPIQTSREWLTAKQWLEKTCEANGLVMAIHPTGVMISVDDSRINKAISPALSLTDIGDNPPQTFQWLLPLIQAEPTEDGPVQDAGDANEEDLKAHDGEAPTFDAQTQSVVPGASLRSRMRAALAIDALRISQGKAPKLERSRTVRWMGPWPSDDQPTTETSFGDWPLVAGGKGLGLLDAPQAFSGLIRSIGAANGSHVVVGWLDANNAGIYPADTMMPYSRSNSAGELLDDLLGDSGLQTRVCGQGLWYIGSEASYDRYEVITWYQIPAGEGENIRTRLANSLGNHDSSSLAVAYNESQFFVRCPRFLARQMPRIISPPPAAPSK